MMEDSTRLPPLVHAIQNPLPDEQGTESRDKTRDHYIASVDVGCLDLETKSGDYQTLSLSGDLIHANKAYQSQGTSTTSQSDVHSILGNPTPRNQASQVLSVYNRLPHGPVDPARYEDWTKDWLPRLAGGPGPTHDLTGFAIHVSEGPLSGSEGIHPTVLHFNGKTGSALRKSTNADMASSQDIPFIGETQNKNKKKVCKKLYLGSPTKAFQKSGWVPSDKSSAAPRRTPKPSTHRSCLPLDTKRFSSQRPPNGNGLISDEPNKYAFFSFAHSTSTSKGAPIASGSTSSSNSTQEQRTKNRVYKFGNIPRAGEQMGNSPLAYPVIKRGTLQQGRVYGYTVHGVGREVDQLMVTNGGLRKSNSFVEKPTRSVSFAPIPDETATEPWIQSRSQNSTADDADSAPSNELNNDATKSVSS